jgi:hypothetical protein
VLTTCDPIFRSINSAPYLNLGEYDLDDSYADTEPLIAEDNRGWADVSSDSNGSGCGGSEGRVSEGEEEIA